MSSPRFPRLPSVWDGPLGPSKEVLAPEDRPVRTLPRRRAAETPPSPRLPAATPLAGPQDVPAKVLDALEAELLGGPAPAAPAGDPALAAETSSTLAALGGAYDAVLRELAEPEVSAEALVRSWPDQAPSPQAPSGAGDAAPAATNSVDRAPEAPPDLSPAAAPPASATAPSAPAPVASAVNVTAAPAVSPEAVDAALRELDAQDEMAGMLSGLPPVAPIEQEQPRRDVSAFAAEPEEDVAEPDLPEVSPEASMRAIAAILAEEEHELSLLGPAAPQSALRPVQKATGIAVAPEVAAWFAARGIDLDQKADALLRRYMREFDKQRRKGRR